jgi:acyl carrier protein phosphodiesterase
VNWLAHLLLSEPNSGFRVGNLLPDLINVSDLTQIPAVFHRGMACHRRIDAFTDAHPVVRRSVNRPGKPYRRLAPILVDVFYDHFLSVRWAQYSPMPLTQFVREAYDSFEEQRDLLPPLAGEALQRMREENWLESYRDLAGVRLTLERMSRRFRRPIDLAGGVAELERHYADFGADFDAFFPELQRHVAAWATQPG